MHRVKRVEYDEDDLYSEEEDNQVNEEEEYSPEDRANFANLIPVVRAELQEAGLQASDREIEDSLWHYYWDVGKSVSYLKNTRTPRTENGGAKRKEGGGGGGGKKGEGKAKTKFDLAAERNAGEFLSFFVFVRMHTTGRIWRSGCEDF